MRTRLALALLLVAGTAGCSGYPDINGQLAIARTGDRPVVLVHTCTGSVDEVHVSADRQGLEDDEENPVLGLLRAKHPVSGSVAVDLTAPGPDWEVVTPVALPTGADEGVIVTASHRSENTEMQQANARIGQIQGLAAGEALVTGDVGDSRGRLVTVDAFHAGACAGR